MRSLFRLAVGLFILCLGAALFVIFGGMRAPSAPWFSAVTNTNGYDGLLRAAAIMVGNPPVQQTNAGLFVNANTRLFESVQSALELPFEAPLDTYSQTNPPLADLATFKTIALALRAKGWEAERRRADREALASYISIIRLGQNVEHGPLVALLVGMSIEKSGLEAIEKVTARLTPTEREELAEKIQSLDRQRLPFSEVMLRERYFAHRITRNPLRLVLGWFQSRTAFDKAEQKVRRLSSDFRQLSRSLSNGERAF